MSGGSGEAASKQFLEDVERFLRKQGLSATRFGAMAVGDTKFVRSLRKGRIAREKTIREVRDWMARQEAA